MPRNETRDKESKIDSERRQRERDGELELVRKGREGVGSDKNRKMELVSKEKQNRVTEFSQG